MRKILAAVIFLAAGVALLFILRAGSTEQPVTNVPNLSLAEQVGQLLIVNVPGKVLSTAEIKHLRELRPGGVILLKENIADAGQTRDLISVLQSKQLALKQPLFIGIDQEGGPVTRLTFLKQKTAQAKVTTAEQAYQVAFARGLELKGLGINLNFAPVLDVAMAPADFIYGRAFLGDAKQVAAFGRAMIQGYEVAGIIAVAKHFPGHGGSAADSHTKLPTINRTETSQAEHLLPFREAIAADVPMIMVGHLLLPSIDPAYPASLSPRIINDLLREELDYDGVVVTDALNMAAVQAYGTFPRVAVQAVRAGVDMVMVIGTIEEQQAAATALQKAVRDGVIMPEQLTRSVERILQLKRNRRLVVN